jgi:hypothetical protein
VKITDKYMQLASYAMHERFATIKGGYLATLIQIQTTGAQTSKVRTQSEQSRAKRAKQEKESGRDDNLTRRVPVSSSGLPWPERRKTKRNETERNETK